MAGARHQHRRSRGAETLEFLTTMVVLMIVTVGCVMLTNAYGNALAAQHALSQTALYVAANGRYTQAIDQRCAQMLPRGTNGQSDCRAFRVNGAGQVVSEIQPAARVAGTDPVLFGESLRVRVSYSQPWFELCLPDFIANACTGRVSMAIDRHLDIPSLTREVRR